MNFMPGDHSPLGSDPLQAARDLSGALRDMTEQLAQVKTTVRRGKRVIIAIAVSLILDVVLTVGVSVAAVQAGDASAQAKATVAQLHSTQVNACRAGNQTRAEEVALWTHLVSLSVRSRTPTAAQRKADKQLLAYVRAVFKPRDCQKVYAISGRALRPLHK